jgi:hypothetical protein
MGRINDKKLDAYVHDLLTSAGIKGDELSKHIIIYKSFYREVKPALKNVSLDSLCVLISKFLLFVIQFETVCAKAFSPLSGSQSTAREIITMYSSRGITSNVLLERKSRHSESKK